MWLMEHDPGFSLTMVCMRLYDQGFTSYLKHSSGGPVADTSHVLRLLGLKDQTLNSKRGRFYAASPRTAFVKYDTAVAFARALDMDPHEADV